MKVPRAFLSLGEQIFASAFTFFIFIVATRTLAPEDLAIYSAYFSLSQSFTFFLMGLVLLPVASSTGTDTSKQLGISLVLLVTLVGTFALVSPLAMRIFESFDKHADFATWVLAVAFFASQCFYESARWLTIRMRGVGMALPVTIARFLLFFSTIYWLSSGHLGGTGFTLIQVIVNLAAALGYALRLGSLLSTVKPCLPDRNAMRHLATFGNSFASFVTNFAAVVLIDRAWGGAGLAAFQAMRSATNPIGMISQVIDNHFSADLARSGRSISFGPQRVVTIMAAITFLTILAVPLAPEATELLLADGFVQWWPLFPLMLFASLAHAVTRPIFVNWRLAGDTRALHTYSALLLGVILPAMIALWAVGSPFAMVAIFAAQPFVSLLSLTLNRYAYRKIRGTL